MHECVHGRIRVTLCALRIEGFSLHRKHEFVWFNLHLTRQAQYLVGKEKGGVYAQKLGNMVFTTV